MQSSWDCYCTNTKIGPNSQCQPIAMQTDTNTCLGKLATNSAALQVETAFETCLYQDTCSISCGTSAG
jgi:hypothetical protein